VIRILRRRSRLCERSTALVTRHVTSKGFLECTLKLLVDSDENQLASIDFKSADHTASIDRSPSEV